MPAFDEYEDVQGLLRFAHGHMAEARFWLLRIRNAEAARAWLAKAPITNAVKIRPRAFNALQVAFTFDGLRALGVPQALLGGFAPEFVSGPADSNRARRLGDVGPNDPAHWSWGTGGNTPHLVVMTFAQRDLGNYEEAVMGPQAAAAFDTITPLETSDMGGREPFGFMDGVSQPTLDWDQEWHVTTDQMVYRNALALGDVVLGYLDEYRKYTSRPVVERTDELAALLPVCADNPRLGDLGRNGTYMVIRQLEQDVRLFWQSMDTHAAQIGISGKTLAEAAIGRQMDGTPLGGLSPAEVPDLSSAHRVKVNSFTFDDDPEGDRCPLGAHIRRANPRNADFPLGTGGVISRTIRRLGLGIKDQRSDMLSSVRFHRMLRRGREYGPWLAPEDARQPAPAGDPPRGLQFIGLNASIARQFEFIQGAWLMSASFLGTHGETDPILGTRVPAADGSTTDGFSLPQPTGLARRACGLPHFITVKGGAYFFMPGLRALNYLVRVSARAAGH